MNNFGERLKSLRKAAGITQQELADKLNVHLQTVSKWERGISEPDFSLLGEISSVLGVSLEKLLGAEEGESTFTGDFGVGKLGAAILSARSEVGESQERLADVMGVSADAVSRWERGITCPDVNCLQKLAEHFNMPVSKLYYGVSTEPAAQTVAAQSVKRGRVPIIILSVALFIVIIVSVLLLTLMPHFSFSSADSTQDSGADGDKLPVNTPQPVQITVDGSLVSVNENELYAPAIPRREGYEFIGWKDESGNEVSFPAIVEEDDTFFSQFVPREYNIEYWLNGGYFSEQPQSTINVESGSVELSAPQKQGQTFEGWYLSPDYSGAAVERVECSCADIVLYAKWSTVVFTIKYELNGGILYGENPATVTAENSVELTEPVRKGYIFLGWFDGENGGNMYESVGGEGARNLMLYALWQKTDELFTIFYELDGGEPEGENPVSVGAGEVHNLYGASKAGYDFVGWNDEADGGGTYYESLYGIDENLALYAVFIPHEYLVQYVYQGIYEGQSVNPNYITYGDVVELLPVWLYGHEFVGWYTEKEDGSKVTIINKENILNITVLYARYEPLEYEIVLDANGGTVQTDDGENEELVYKMQFGQTLELPVPEYGGYNFIGWKSESGEYVSEINATNICDMTLTAEWRPSDLSYNLTYVLDGGTLEENNPQYVLVGQALPLNEPVREDYIFLGWYDNPNGEGTRYYSTPTDRLTDLTLYAVWQRIVVNGSYKDFGYEKSSSSVTITSYSGSYGENIDLIIPSVIDGLPVIGIGTDDVLESNKNGWPQSIFGKYPVFRSVTIPEGVVTLNTCVFFEATVTEPVRIPSTVTYIGDRCFAYFNGEVCFSDEGNLKRIGEYAFNHTTFRGTLVVPYGVEVLETGAFYDVRTTGIILPQTVEVIMSYAFYQPNGYVQQIFIPSSVKYLASQTGTVYTDMSEEQIIGLYGSSWGPIYADIGVSTITLTDGGNSQKISGYAFDLPVLQKEGYTFLGWKDESGQFVPDCYIPNRDAVLAAAYEKNSATDGRTPDMAKILEAGQTYEYIALDGQDFYFKFSGLSACKIIVTVDNIQSVIYRYHSNSQTVIQNGWQSDYVPGDYFSVYAEQIEPGTKITIQIVAL